jgi:hypothetical protein
VLLAAQESADFSLAVFKAVEAFHPAKKRRLSSTKFSEKSL